MAANPIFLTELVLCEGGAVAFAVWEFWKIRPGKTDEIEKAEARSAFARVASKAASPEPTGHSEGEHRPDQG